MVADEVLHPEEVITRVIFLRHGHTKQTEAGQLYNDLSSPLTDKGFAQAKAAAGWLPKEEAELLLSSEAQRVQATAGIIGEALGLSVYVISSLPEQNIGEWEGRTYLDIKKNDPEVYKAWCKDPIRNSAPGGESIEQMSVRVSESLKQLVEQHAGKRILIATHAGVIRSALVEALGMPIDNFWRISIPTGSLSRIDYSNNFACVHYVAVSP